VENEIVSSVLLGGHFGSATIPRLYGACVRSEQIITVLAFAAGHVKQSTHKAGNVNKWGDFDGVALPADKLLLYASSLVRAFEIFERGNVMLLDMHRGNFESNEDLTSVALIDLDTADNKGSLCRKCKECKDERVLLRLCGLNDSSCAKCQADADCKWKRNHLQDTNINWLFLPPESQRCNVQAGRCYGWTLATTAWAVGSMLREFQNATTDGRSRSSFSELQPIIHGLMHKIPDRRMTLRDAAAQLLQIKQDFVGS
jgi:hypothetical protein